MFISSSDMSDSTIKLFGNTISLKETHFPISSTLSVEKSDQDCQSSVVDSEIKNGCIEEIEEEDTSIAEKCGTSNKSSSCDAGKEDNHQRYLKDNKPEGSEPETDTMSEEKVLKKPDKIIPCPRCNSLETKFCYYNNYNVSQPRHFCKKCQRYWTAGGTMRNVPVGAGRRKTNKHFDSQHRQLIVSATEDPMSWVCSALARPVKGSETIPKFALGTPDFKEKCLSSDKLKQENKIGSLVCVDDGEEPSSCGSSITASSCRENELPGNAANIEKGSMPGSCNGLSPTHPLQLYPGLPWPYSWNSGWNNVVPMTVVGQCSPEMIYGAENGISRPVEWLPSSPAFCPQAIAFSFASPPTYWPCMPEWSVGAFHVPWVGPSTSSCTSPTSSTTNSGYSGNISPCLGKHPRDSNPEEDKLEKCFWVPKTRRISDRDDKAENSIWTTLGIKRNQNEPITEGGIFKAFEPKIQGHAHTLDARQILRANPAAFCRSQSFQEST